MDDQQLNQNQGAYQDPSGQQPQFPTQPAQPVGQPDPQYQAPQSPGPQQPPVAAPQPGQPQRPPLRIDDALLSELGLGTLADEERKALQKHIYETLEMNVGMRLADQMSNEQLDEFEQYFNARDDAGASRWLETNFPNYKDIVADEFEKLKVEVKQNAPQILTASQQHAPEPPQMNPPSGSPDSPPPDPQTPPNYQQ
jgi:hypothetical protein